jgi:hypothetical protein
MANNANSVLTTNFNVSPYYDDYDENKFFYRMLFKPGYAVQGRELSQMQTMLQKQIDRFGKHVFREGSIVLPGEFLIETDLDYVKIKDVDTSNNEVSIDSYLNLSLVGQTNNIRAFVVNVLDGTETDANTKTLYIKYQTGSDSNTSISNFVADEVLISDSQPNLTVVSSSPTGKAARFLIREGVFFAKEHFIKFNTQSSIIGRYTTTPSCRIGFKVIEQIVNSTMDTSLLDPALEASNYYAPGADRLKLIPELEIRDIADETGIPEFVELLTIKEGVVTEQYDRSQYNILRDEMAKRTEDESGDYYVRGLNVRIRENYDTGINGGLTIAGNSQFLSVGVEPGVAYVKGYEINKLVTDYVNITKAIDYSNVSSQIGTTTIGSYVTLTQVSGAPVADKGSQITLYENRARSIEYKTWDAQPNSSAIGTARIASFEYNSETLGTANASILLYITDIKMNGSNTFSNVKSVFLNNAGARANLVGDVLLNSSNNAILNDVRSGALLYQVGSSAVKTVRDSAGNPSLQFNFLRTDDVTVTGATGAFTVSLTTGAEGETLPYGTVSELSDSDKREIIVTLNQSANILASGTVSANGGVGDTYTLTGLVSAFNRFNVGDKIAVAGRTDTSANIFTIAAIAGDTSLTTIENLPPSINGNTFFKVYKAGDIIDLTTKGMDVGAERTVGTTPTLLSFDLQETFTSDLSATVTYQVVRTGAREVQKLLRPARYVKINVASHSAGTTGPYTLGFSDVYKVRKIIKKTSTFPTSNTDGTDVTTSFTFNNGQADMFYDHASITPNAKLVATDRLLVELDYFEPSFAQGKGYFSIDSYPIDDTTVSATTIRTEEIPFFVSPRDKSLYNLRNYIDVRPVKSASAVGTTNIAAASINPAVSTVFNYETNGLRLPMPSTQFSYDFSFYYPRRDLVTIDKNGFVTIIKGTPTSYPITPSTPGNVMALASIFITPYPSLAPNYGKILRRPDISCVIKKLSNVRFTMRDIGLLKQRIENLEYYASLSLLEKSAAEMKILDENGLERFKNGIFVDSFANHELGDVLNPNYRIVVDPEERSIRPKFTMNSIGYDYKNGTNVRKTGDLVTLDYTEVPLLEQNTATSFRNVELTSYRFLGELYMNPETDVWVDTEYAPDEVIVQGSEVANSSVTSSIGTTWGSWQTTWNSWQSNVTGFQAYNSKGQLVGTYSTLAQAQAQFDSDRVTKLTSTSQFIGPTGGQTYGTVTNVYVSGQFYSSYSLSPGDGMIYEITSTSGTGTSTRTGTETFQTTTTTSTSTTENIGTKIIDVSLIPYIRPQIIKIYARGLKPKTRVYPFFDNEAMYMYTRPITANMYNDVPNSYTENEEGDELITDEYGEIFINLRLPPEKQFRMGTKEVILTDSPTNSIDASTKAVAYFVAAGLLQEKQNTILTTRGSTTTTSSQTVAVTDSKSANTNTTTKKFVSFIEDVSCSAYSFVPKSPNGEEGVFLTSADIYFAAKHPTLGVWCEIREMDNAGGITRNQVPFSEVWISAADIVTSTDATVAQKVTFPSPVFLYNDVQYAFVIHTVGINPDTYVWVARLGENNISTGNQHSARPLTGTFYTTNNNRNWDMVPDIDLKIRFYRANFITNVVGEAILGNKTTEEVVLTTITDEIYNYGEPYVGRYRLTVSGNTSSISANDIIVGETSGTNTTVVMFDSNTNTIKAEHVYDYTKTPPGLLNALFIQNERLQIYHSNGEFKGVTTAINSIERALARLKRKKKIISQNTTSTSAIAEFSSETTANTKFEVGDVMLPSLPQTYVTLTPSGNGSGGTITVQSSNVQRMVATVGEIRNMRYSVADFEPSLLTFNRTVINFEMKTTSNTFIGEDYFKINPNENYYFNTEKAILSKTNELEYLGGSPSNNVKAFMTSTTNYLSPVIDLGRTHTVIVDNIVNANTYAEDATGVTLKVSGNLSSILTDDVLLGTGGGNSSVMFVSGNNVIITVPNTAFSIGEVLTVYEANLVSKNVTTTIVNIIKDNKKVGGELINKYISKPITLAEGQDAEDLLVFLTAYKPPGTQIKVWVKILHNEDYEPFNQLPWIELTSGETEAYSTLANRNDFIELRYTFPEATKTGPNSEVQYTNGDGNTFTGFKYYAIKIGLLAENSAVVPKVGDLRAIAIQI